MQVILMHYGCRQFIIQTKPEEPDEGATYKEKLDLQLRKFPVYRATNLQMGRGLQAVKNLSRADIKANRLQLMKQDLEKKENAYLSSLI
ncbi:hypothetical protein TNIN_194831 [Trichonephila inaurata madagascariensis]|uniref:Uncharacterized protein n=1 Tax=Trichonephila inaurata madagascariensis TaxID=2747483 RepID=A0A8X7CME4_9ARAC|nr:hypothetical protein TNIN_194831 [Trichonephila inaurata madagascariensis]